MLMNNLASHTKWFNKLGSLETCSESSRQQEKCMLSASPNCRQNWGIISLKNDFQLETKGTL